MISFVKKEAVLPLRSEVLRDNKSVTECIFPGDDEMSSFHLADIHDHEIVCVASFHHQAHPGFEGNGYQLRGMATAPGYRGRGLGNQLVNFAIVYLRGQSADYLWCNARKAAFSFYVGQGFEFISDEFDIPGIGPHRTMYLKVR
jgi:predicted GNAT family N-acyltransferase